MKRRDTSVLILVAVIVAGASFAVLDTSPPSNERAPDVALSPPRWDSLLGALSRGGADVPDSMRVGVPATIRFSTEHSNTCVRSAGAEVRLADLVAIIRPHDFIGSGMQCGAEVTNVAHEASITFHRAGIATIRVEQRSGEPLERQIVIR